MPSSVLLHKRGVTWVPGVLASGGHGTYAVSREGMGPDKAAAKARVGAIGGSAAELFGEMERVARTGAATWFPAGAAPGPTRPLRSLSDRVPAGPGSVAAV
ncbi:hypothetical protein Airi02_105670 [Actinoallomurus iriomotensis]|uniref:Uncharacterized protein n=1 Tax=Actinoallomurus iriomotensis TaxID=478107 RepID=A0A9W6SFI4_9ACTN|nr:hypothetical protein Airi02_105670 [Actinoallomurus iriomotensis]